MDILRKADPLDVFARVVGDSMEEFPMPKPWIVEHFKATHRIKPIVARPVTAQPIAARPISMVPGEPMTLKSSECEEDSPVDVAHILKDVATHRAGCNAPEIN